MTREIHTARVIHIIRHLIRKSLKWIFNPFYTFLCKSHVKVSFWWYEFSGRWRARYYSRVLGQCGDNLIINGRPYIYHPEKIHLGNNVTINSHAQIAPRGEVYIGNYVTMSRGSQITAGQLDINKWMDEQETVHSHVSKPVYIADGTWLCVNSVVLPGVSIKGKGCIVAAGAVVTHDVNEDYVIVAGIPAKIIKYLNQK